jgi:hypothetical protein
MQASLSAKKKSNSLAGDNFHVRTRSRHRQQQHQKQRRKIAKLLQRVPICEIIEFCQLEEREVTKLLSKTWQVEELLSRQRFFFDLCSEDPEFPFMEFHSNVDYRQRYIQLLTTHHKRSPFHKSNDESESCNKFNDEYTISFVGMINDPAEGLTQVFQDTVLATMEGNSLCFDLEFDEDDLPVVDFSLGTSQLQIWIERKSDHKMGLFGTHTGLFASFSGFEPDGTVFSHNHEDTGVGDDFHGGHGWWWSRGESGMEEHYSWSNRRENYDFGTDSFEYAFRQPEPQDILEGIDEADGDAIDAAYEQWYEKTTESLRRVKIVYKQRASNANDYHNYVYHQYMYDEPAEPEPFKPSELDSLFVPNVRWI